MTTEQLRKLFLDFFEGQDHLVRPSAPLVLHDDPTSFFTSAGMQPYMAAFRGEEEPPAPRVVSIQKITRTGDIELVGHQNRYHTFFEMLGNFSFGDYFKQGAIELAWEFVTEVLQLPLERLWFSVYLEDDEAEQIWHKYIGIPMSRIRRLGREDNWWPKVRWEGPCGPCSEIFVDLGEERGCPGGCEVGCDRCERYLELWNLVFQMYTEAEDGTLTPLPSLGIDTGMGLERLAMVMQNKRFTAETDELFHILSRSLEQINQFRDEPYTYGQDEATDVGLRVIADHLRATAFLMADGIVPTNEGPGYVLRRLIRRAYRFGRQAGATGPFLHEALPAVAEIMASTYLELDDGLDYQQQVVKSEEKRFASTLAEGIGLFEEIAEQTNECGGTVIPGEEAFRLHDTHGLTIDIVRDLAAEKNMTVDERGFEEAMEEQRERSRGESVGLQQVASGGPITFGGGGVTTFAGYESTKTEKCKVEALYYEERDVKSLQTDQEGIIILDETPFYAERGGQVGDTGVIQGPNGRFQVSNTVPEANSILHLGTVTEGEISQDDKVTARVDEERRNAIQRHHTATHLLQAALRRFVGDHVRQSGSLVAPDHLRFDFTHHEAVGKDVLENVEAQVNAWIMADLAVSCTDKPLKEAKAEGIIAVFGEKYGEIVRVVRIGDISAELCGGTHCDRTGQIGSLRITSESSVAAGIRRIEAVVGQAALQRAHKLEAALNEVTQQLSITPEELPARLAALQEQISELEKQLQQARQMQATTSIADILENAVSLGPVTLITAWIEGADDETLGTVADQLTAEAKNSIICLAGTQDDGATLIIKLGKDAANQGYHAGDLMQIVAPLAGGGGGGGPSFARGGGKASKIDEAFAGLRRHLEEQTGHEGLS